MHTPEVLQIPARIEDATANVALVIHWRPSDVADMTLAELIDWRGRARVRHESADTGQE